MPTASEIEQAIEQAVKRYFDDCRGRIPAFTQQHFRYPGALYTNRAAVGWDIARAPLNLLWAPLYTLVCLVKALLPKRAKQTPAFRFMDNIPAGFNTKVQAKISQLIQSDLLRLETETGENLITEPEFERHLNSTLGELALRYKLSEPLKPTKNYTPQLAQLIHEVLGEYQVSRNANADISNSLSCTIVGAFAFQKFTPGGIGIALMLATMLSNKIAAENFVFGTTLGKLYYDFLPQAPTLGLTLAVIAGVLSLLAGLAALSGVVTDPIQAVTGIHQYRLRKMLNALEADFIEQYARPHNNKNTQFYPKDQFVARIMDSFDVVRSNFL